jgi:hypothetical protein
LGVFIFGGCNKEIKGPPRVNLNPIVNFVNIPVEGARFSSDTTIYWYGTDADGFIKYFRYAVVESVLVGPDPAVYVQGRSDTAFPWVVVDVTLENPGTKEKINMSADISDPVRKFVASYVFLQAIDNMGAKSSIVYRMFRKNNHFPNTRLTANSEADPYVNAKTSTGVLEGVSFSYYGEDLTDYPRNPPPFEYHWKMLGPYSESERNLIDSLYTESTFVDIYGDFYYPGDTLFVINYIDTVIIPGDPPDTTIDTVYNAFPVDDISTGSAYGSWGIQIYIDSLPTGLNRLVEESYDPVTDSFWVTDMSANVYDVFRYEDVTAESDTTRQEYFLVWVQARDDAKTPDPVPPYQWTTVIEPKFEREVLLLDLTDNLHGRAQVANVSRFYSPDNTADSTLASLIFYSNMIENWKPGCFDTENILPFTTIYDEDGVALVDLDYPRFDCTQDFLALGSLRTNRDNGIVAISLRDVLKHKIMIILKDSPSKIIDENTLESRMIIKGISSGMSAWLMARGPYFSQANAPYPILYPMQTSIQNYFGVSYANYTGWFGADKYIITASTSQADNPFGFGIGRWQIRIEDFIGAIPVVATGISGVYPELVIDTLRLERLYDWAPGIFAGYYPFRCATGGQMMTGALPEVGYISKSSAAEAMYHFNSKYDYETPRFIPSACGAYMLTGWEQNDEGKIVACRYETELFRTAYFAFSLLPMDTVASQTVFNEMMDWLSVQPYITTGKKAPSSAAKANIEELRRINKVLDEKYRNGELKSIGDAE